MIILRESFAVHSVQPLRIREACVRALRDLDAWHCCIIPERLESALAWADFKRPVLTQACPAPSCGSAPRT